MHINSNFVYNKAYFYTVSINMCNILHFMMYIIIKLRTNIMGKITNVQIDLLKAFVKRFDLDFVYDGQSISFENAVRVFEGEMPVPKTRDERRNEFIGSLSPYLQTYGSKMLNDFYRYWAREDGAKMRFEGQKSWNVELRLAKWKSNQDEYERNNYIQQLTKRI